MAFEYSVKTNIFYFSDKLIRLFSWNTKSKAFVEDEKSPLRHHTFSVNEVRFSPQGTMLVTGSSDGTAVIWDLAVNEFTFSKKKKTREINKSIFCRLAQFFVVSCNPQD